MIENKNSKTVTILLFIMYMETGVINLSRLKENGAYPHNEQYPELDGHGAFGIMPIYVKQMFNSLYDVATRPAVITNILVPSLKIGLAFSKQFQLPVLDVFSVVINSWRYLNWSTGSSFDIEDLKTLYAKHNQGLNGSPEYLTAAQLDRINLFFQEKEHFINSYDSVIGILPT